MSDNKCKVPETISIDGTVYVRADKTTPPVTGKRAVIVVDRGWILAGDAEYKDGRIFLSRVVHVRSWEGVGFDGMIADPTKKVNLRKLPNCDIPQDSEIFKVPVPDNWGL